MVTMPELEAELSAAVAAINEDNPVTPDGRYVAIGSAVALVVGAVRAGTAAADAAAADDRGGRDAVPRDLRGYAVAL